MDNFVIRKRSSDHGGGQPSKRPRGADEDGEPAGRRREPLKLMSLNANGLGVRLGIETDKKELCAVVDKEKPDIIAIQEVRLPCAGPKGAKRDDKTVKRTHSQVNTNDKKGQEEQQRLSLLMRNETFKDYKVYLSLATWRYAGSAVMVHKDCLPDTVYYNVVGEEGHHFDGRVIVMEFGNLTIVATYAPNNGTPSKDGKEDSFARRRKWDAEMKAFLVKMKAQGRDVVWLGDLNVAHRRPDVTDPDWFSEQMRDPAPRDYNDGGQPGYTFNEQDRFTGILQESGLVDAFRHANPADEPCNDRGSANWTWRGTGAATDRYHNKGMRIDYTLVSSSLLPRVQSALIRS